MNIFSTSGSNFMRRGIAEVYANSLYHYQPDILVPRWWVPAYPILVGGSLIDAADYHHLNETFGITHVINVETEHDDVGKVPEGHLFQVQVPDDGGDFPLEGVRNIISFMKGSPDGAFYIHCQMGGSRSPAFAYAALRGVWGLSPIDALETLNVGFLEKKNIAKDSPAYAQAETRYGWHPYHQKYLGSVEEALA